MRQRLFALAERFLHADKRSVLDIGWALQYVAEHGEPELVTAVYIELRSGVREWPQE